MIYIHIFNQLDSQLFLLFNIYSSMGSISNSAFQKDNDLFPHYTNKDGYSIGPNSITIILPHPIINQQQALQTQQIIQIRKKLCQHPNFSTVIRGQMYYETYGCHSYQYLNLHYPYHPKQRSLKAMIQAKIANKDTFLEKTICDVAYKLASVTDWLWENQTCHGDIRPQNIFIVLPGGEKKGKMQLKVLDSYFINSCRTNYEMILQAPQQTFLLSHRQLEGLKKSILHNRPRPEDQVYSIGITLLEMMTLQKSSQCYNLRLKQLNQDVIEKRLEQAAKKYRKDLVFLVSQMLNKIQYSYHFADGNDSILVPTPVNKFITFKQIMQNIMVIKGEPDDSHLDKTLNCFQNQSIHSHDSFQEFLHYSEHFKGVKSKNQNNEMENSQTVYSNRFSQNLSDRNNFIFKGNKISNTKTIAQSQRLGGKNHEQSQNSNMNSCSIYFMNDKDNKKMTGW